MKPKICLTASAFLFHQGKVLLVKHQKLKQWLGPGGHLEENELPHEAAVREFLEETGLKIKIQSALKEIKTDEKSTDYFHPVPVAINEHWVCQENYQARLKAEQLQQAFIPHPKWPKGCERHFNFAYVAKLAGPLEIKPQSGESEEIAWFTLEDLLGPYRQELASSILTEVTRAFEYAKIFSYVPPSSTD